RRATGGGQRATGDGRWRRAAGHPLETMSDSASQGHDEGAVVRAAGVADVAARGEGTATYEGVVDGDLRRPEQGLVLRPGRLVAVAGLGAREAARFEERGEAGRERRRVEIADDRVGARLRSGPGG